jgi:hypothetical protein
VADPFAERIWGIPWTIVALLALAVAVIFVFVDTSAGATGLRYVVVRWFHSLCWLLLALSALAMAGVTPLPANWAGALATSGGIVYAIFLAATLIWRQ